MNFRPEVELFSTRIGSKKDIDHDRRHGGAGGGGDGGGGDGDGGDGDGGTAELKTKTPALWSGLRYQS